MNKHPKISVLDQSFTRAADQAPIALAETIEMAKFCEGLGFHRFWVSEHHAFSTIAGSAPEVLLAAIGMATERIRIGSGGIMLPHYSAYKVAETFSLLANLFPGRVDLGIGRAPGADMSTAVALATDGRPKFERFPQLVSELTDYLRSDSTQPVVSPKPPEDLPIWMLGTSPDSAQLAAQRGLPYNLGLFINPQADAGMVEYYRYHFKPTPLQHKPYAVITTGVFCCETEQEAKRQQHTFDVNFYRYVSGQIGSSGLLSPEQAQEFPMNAQLEAFIKQRNTNRAVGTPTQVAQKLKQTAEHYGADEVMAVTNMFHFEQRKESFRLLCEAWDDLDQ